MKVERPSIFDRTFRDDEAKADVVGQFSEPARRCLEQGAEVAIRQITGQFTSKHLIYAPPAGKLLADIREAYGAHVYPAAT